MSYGETVRAEDFLSSYKLGPGDVMSITVFDEENMAVNKVRLTEQGTITFPTIGEFSVLNKTIGDVEALVINKLKVKILVNPRVTVTLDEYRPFYIAGGVRKPGGFPFSADLTVSKAISLAGGLTDRADKSKIYFVDKNNNKKLITEEALVNPDDNIFIEEYNPIYVNGMVNKPGGYPFQEGLNVRKAIALAGGFNERAAIGKIYLIRSGAGNQAVRVSLDDAIQPDDIIFIEESFF